MSGEIEAVLKTSSFDGFDEDGNRHTYHNGDIVYLSEEQFKGFADQFELVEEIVLEDDDGPKVPEPEMLDNSDLAV